MAKIVSSEREVLRALVNALGLGGRPITSVTITADIQHVPIVQIVEHLDDEAGVAEVVSRYRLEPIDTDPDRDDAA